MPIRAAEAGSSSGGALGWAWLGDPVDLLGEHVEVAGLDRAERPLRRVQHPLAHRVGAFLSVKSLVWLRYSY